MKRRDTTAGEIYDTCVKREGVCSRTEEPAECPFCWFCGKTDSWPFDSDWLTEPEWSEYRNLTLGEIIKHCIGRQGKEDMCLTCRLNAVCETIFGPVAMPCELEGLLTD